MSTAIKVIVGGERSVCQMFGNVTFPHLCTHLFIKSNTIIHDLQCNVGGLMDGQVGLQNTWESRQK